MDAVKEYYQIRLYEVLRTDRQRPIIINGQLVGYNVMVVLVEAASQEDAENRIPYE